MQPLHLLLLPVEIRLSIYEFLPLTTKDIVFTYPTPRKRAVPQFTLVVKTAPILTVCTRIRAEATSIIQPRLLAEPLRFILDTSAIRRFFDRGTNQVPCLWMRIAERAAQLRLNANNSFHANVSAIDTSNEMEGDRDVFVERCAFYMLRRGPTSTVIGIKDYEKWGATRTLHEFVVAIESERYRKDIPRPLTIVVDEESMKGKQRCTFEKCVRNYSQYMGCRVVYGAIHEGGNWEEVT